MRDAHWNILEAEKNHDFMLNILGHCHCAVHKPLINHLFKSLHHGLTFQYASGIRRGRTREEAVPVGGTQCPQPAATQKFFHKK